MAVFVLDSSGRPLMPCSEKRARLLLGRGRARVHRLVPMVIRIIDRTQAASALQPLLKAMTLPVELSTGGRTKFNRSRLSIPKTHALDAACVGDLASVTNWHKPTLNIKCTGRGSYQRTRLDKFGFPRGYLMRSKSIHGFQTGDRVKAAVTTGTKMGAYSGRVAIRASGSFNIQTSQGLVQGIAHRHCKVVQRAMPCTSPWLV